MNDPIGAVKKLGRVSLDCRRRQMLSFSPFRSLLFPLFHAFPCVHVTNIVFYYSIFLVTFLVLFVIGCKRHFRMPDNYYLRGNSVPRDL